MVRSTLATLLVCALLASSVLAETRLKVALLAACGAWLDRPSAPRLAGQILAIRDTSDDLAGSCQGAFARAVPGSTFRELELDLGRGHGLFYRPDPEWVDPLVAWATAD
jgi:hypothetical protein